MLSTTFLSSPLIYDQHSEEYFSNNLSQEREYEVTGEGNGVWKDFFSNGEIRICFQVEEKVPRWGREIEDTSSYENYNSVVLGMTRELL